MDVLKKRSPYIITVYEQLRKKLALASPVTMDLDMSDERQANQVRRVLTSRVMRPVLNKVYGIEAVLLTDGRVAASWPNRGFEVPANMVYQPLLRSA